MSGLYDLYLAQGCVPDSSLEEDATSGPRIVPVAQTGKIGASIDRARIFAARKAQTTRPSANAAVEHEADRVQSAKKDTPAAGSTRSLANIDRDRIFAARKAQTARPSANAAVEREADSMQPVNKDTPAASPTQSVAAFAADFWAKRKGL